MGLFDKLKSAVNVVTGGGANVVLEFQPPVAFPGDYVRVRLTITSTGNQLQSKGTFIDLVGVEHIQVPNRAEGNEGAITITRNTFEQEIQVGPAFTLPANGTQQFEGQFQVPLNAQPSYQGRYARHEWQLRGRMEAFGNDPDSGYLPFRIGLRQ